MEQKQLDELDESYFGEEFIDDDSFDDLEDAPRADAREESDDDFDDIVIEDLATKSKTEKKIAQKMKITSRTGKMEKSNDDITSEENSFYKEKKPLGEEKKASADLLTQKKKAVKESPKKEMKSSAVDVSPTVNPWEGDSIKSTGKSDKPDKLEKTSESSLFVETSTWKAISAVVVVLLIFSVFTQGFHFSESSQITTGAVAGEGAMAGKEITLAQAEKRVLDYVNQNLLQPPYKAELVSSSELKDVFKVSLSVSGQNVDSYLTKDGRYFFPQGFDISYAIVVETDDSGNVNNAEVVDDTAPPHADKVVTAPVGDTVEETTAVNTEEEGLAASVATKELSLTAKKWLFSPQELAVKSGDKVVLTIVPEGLDFTFVIPELGVEKQVSGTTTVEFTASKRGEFEFSCSSCESWRGMTGTLLVE